MTPIIEFKDVSFSYPPDGMNGEKVIFRDFSLKVSRGDRLIIRGKSGCGKTTLLRLMAWLEEPCAGAANCGGRPYSTYYPPDLRRQVSLVSQTPVMMDGSVRSNMALGLDEPVSGEILLSWMDRFDLDRSLLERQAGSLSVGQQQRVAVIRNLLLKPKVLLLDEPTSGLDQESGEVFVTAMGRICEEEGLTLVWNSHNASSLESIASSTFSLDGIVL
ncbi:MAG TPA: ATP-binding cassette domain-containing protein [Nitrospirae bacterium]|nr:ATP-binding cassette domain-containing protein [Nitrospirota bacterium]